MNRLRICILTIAHMQKVFEQLFGMVISLDNYHKPRKTVFITAGKSLEMFPLDYAVMSVEFSNLQLHYMELCRTNIHDKCWCPFINNGCLLKYYSDENINL